MEFNKSNRKQWDKIECKKIKKKSQLKNSKNKFNERKLYENGKVKTKKVLKMNGQIEKEIKLKWEKKLQL